METSRKFLSASVITLAMSFFLPAIAQAESAIEEGKSMLPKTVAMNGMSSMDGMKKKRYRYRKRTHRMQVGAQFIPWSRISDRNLRFDVDLLYGYNAGQFEVGPNLSLSSEGGKVSLNLDVGGWAEFNFIKNVRKNEFVPALGLKINYSLMKGNQHNLLFSPYVSVKYFLASRTGLVASLNFDVLTELRNFAASIDYSVDLSLAYVHYFH